MMYQSLIAWRDLTDKHLYQPGDTFPHDGRAIPAERVASLLSGNNRAGIAVIRRVEDAPEENPIEEPETPKKAVRSRKKAVQK